MGQNRPSARWEAHSGHPIFSKLRAKGSIVLVSRAVSMGRPIEPARITENL